MNRIILVTVIISNISLYITKRHCTEGIILLTNNVSTMLTCLRYIHELGTHRKYYNADIFINALIIESIWYLSDLMTLL